MPICYIVGAGDFYGTLDPKPDDLVIAADGCYLALKNRDIRCDILLGDMDSLSELKNQPSSQIKCADISIQRLNCATADPQAQKPEIMKFKVEKDETDTHLAYLEGARRGYTEFMIFGGTGGREDHTFANYSLLLYGKNAGHRITLVGKDREFFVIKNEIVTLSGTIGKGLSVFAFGSVAEGVSIQGAKYEACQVTLTPDFPLGVSNSFIGNEVTVSVARGALLIMKEK
jgi:thiamine pyrophosphokinase